MAGVTFQKKKPEKTTKIFVTLEIRREQQLFK